MFPVPRPLIESFLREWSNRLLSRAHNLMWAGELEKHFCALTDTRAVLAVASFVLLAEIFDNESRNFAKPSSSSGHKYFTHDGVNASINSSVNSANLAAEAACFNVFFTHSCRLFLAHAGRTS